MVAVKTGFSSPSMPGMPAPMQPMGGLPPMPPMGGPGTFPVPQGGNPFAPLPPMPLAGSPPPMMQPPMGGPGTFPVAPNRQVAPQQVSNAPRRKRFGDSLETMLGRNQGIGSVPQQRLLPMPQQQQRMVAPGTPMMRTPTPRPMQMGGEVDIFGYEDGGIVPRQTSIGDQPHMLAYINQDEEALLRSFGGSGIAGPGGIPSYPPDDVIARDYSSVGGGRGTVVESAGERAAAIARDMASRDDNDNKRSSTVTVSAFDDDDEDYTPTSAQLAAQLAAAGQDDLRSDTSVVDYTKTGSDKDFTTAAQADTDVSGAEFVSLTSGSPAPVTGGVDVFTPTLASEEVLPAPVVSAPVVYTDNYGRQHSSQAEADAANRAIAAQAVSYGLGKEPFRRFGANYYDVVKPPEGKEMAGDRDRIMARAADIFPAYLEQVNKLYGEVGQPAKPFTYEGIGAIGLGDNRDGTQANLGAGTDPNIPAPPPGSTGITVPEGSAVLQFGTFAEREEAEAEIERLKNSLEGFPVNYYIEPVERMGNTIYRIRGDGFVDFDHAARAGSAIIDQENVVPTITKETFTTGGLGLPQAGENIFEQNTFSPNVNPELTYESGKGIGDRGFEPEGTQIAPEAATVTFPEISGGLGATASTVRDIAPPEEGYTSLSNIKDRISRAEGTADEGGYDRLLGGTEDRFGIKPTEMTVQEVLDFQSNRGEGSYADYAEGAVGRISTPVGKYQVVGTTLQSLVDQGIIDANANFDAATQEKIGTHLIMNDLAGGKGLSDLKSGDITADQFEVALGKQFEGIERGLDKGAGASAGTLNIVDEAVRQVEQGRRDENVEKIKAQIGDQAEPTGVENVFYNIIGGLGFGLGKGLADDLRDKSREERQAIIDQHVYALENGATPQTDEEGNYIGFDISTMDTFADKVLAADDISVFLPGGAEDADGDGVSDYDRFRQVYDAQSEAAKKDPYGMSTEQGFITEDGREFFVDAGGNVVEVTDGVVPFEVGGGDDVTDIFTATTTTTSDDDDDTTTTDDDTNYTTDKDGNIVCNNPDYVYNPETEKCEPKKEEETDDDLGSPISTGIAPRSFDEVLRSVVVPAPDIPSISTNIRPMQSGGMAGLNRAADNFLKALAG